MKGGVKTNKKQIITFALIATLAFSLGLVTKTVWEHQDPRVRANLYLYEGTGANARLLSKSGNLIVDLGENVTLFSLNGANQTLLAISTGNTSSINATVTILDSEATTLGFDRVACNVSSYWFNSGDIARNYTALFRATGTIIVDSVGLHWNVTDNTDNNMFACAWITDGTDHTFPTDSTLTAIWVITVNAN